MEPISVIVTALALGAAAGLQSTAKQVVKDAYAGLKGLLQRRYQQVSVAQLEQSPKSEARRAVVEEDLANAGADKDAEILAKSKELLDVVQAQAPEAAGAIGVSLANIKAGSLTIERILASGAGVVAKDLDLRGDLKIADVQAGRTRKQDPKP